MMWGPSDTGRMTRPRQDFWAITSYYNLTESARRLRNYRCFKRRLSVPLLTVEWHPDSRFQLHDNDADIILRVGGGDLMWQKERLLSLAVAAVPDTVKYVAWLDCDVLFENRDWADEARELLKNNSVVQLFSDVAYAGATIAEQRVAPAHDAVLIKGRARPVCSRSRPGHRRA